MTVQRPPRFPAHSRRDVLLAQFHAAGIIPIVSTNGGIPEADIQVVKGAKPGEVVECWVTAHGTRRIAAAQPAHYDESTFGINVSDNR